jgi:uncharacterized protein
MSTGFEQIAHSAGLLQLKKEHRKTLQAMRGCPEFPVCQGWCPHERYVSVRHNQGHRDDCCGLRDLIAHLRRRMADEPPSLRRPCPAAG